MRLCKRGEEKRCLKMWAARYMYFSKYGEWDDDYKRVLVL